MPKLSRSGHDANSRGWNSAIGHVPSMPGQWSSAGHSQGCSHRGTIQGTDMSTVHLCESKDEFRTFIDEYEGELRVDARRAYEGNKLVAVII